MGGVAGHMDHLYDNPSLTFSKMIEIMEAASNGELTTEEKVDGQNLFLSYSVPEGKAKGARNKGNLRSGGLDAEGLAQKFAGRGNLLQSFTDGFSAFEQAVKALSDEEKQAIFGPDTNIWYNAEIMDPGSRNVINYDGKTLKIHNVGHFVFDRESGEQKEIPSNALPILDNALERMQQELNEHDFSLAREALIKLKALEDKQPLIRAKSELKKVLSAEGLPLDSNVRDYLFSRLMNGIDLDGGNDLKRELVKYLLGMPDSIGKRALKKGLPKDLANEIDTVVNRKRMLLQDAIYPLEMVVHDFTVEILKGLKSVFIADNEKEVARLKEELAAAVKDITDKGPEDPTSMEVMQRHLNKIKDFSRITTPVEAVVFDYDGHTYKFAGNFAPINQILGLFRYPKGGKKITSESLTLDSETIVSKPDGKRVALIPGGFNPPHAGHFLLAKHFANKKDVDEVIVVVSTKSRPPVTVDMAIKLWEIYTKDFPKIKVQAGKTPSPVGDVYDLIADKNVFQEGDTVLLGKSEKDTGDQRFDRAQSYAERHNPGVDVESVITPLFAGGVSGTQMRNLILMGEDGKADFKSNLPRHLSAEEKEEVYQTVTDTRERLNRFVDSTLEEISAMGVGSVAGYMGPQKRQKNKSPIVRAKKPIVRRAKRRRRR